MVSVRNIGYRIGGKQVLQNISLDFPTGRLSVMLGPNGSGKSSLLKIFSGYTDGFMGSVLYHGEDTRALSKAGMAQYRAVMSQQPQLDFPLLVDEVVMMGRYPHFTFNPGKKDQAICGEVMQMMELLPLRHRNYLTLSEGEKQRVQFARVLAQVWNCRDKGFLFLDEPIASLDIRYQHAFLSMARDMAARQLTVVAVLHDLNLAMEYADRIVLLKDGKLVATGNAGSTMTAAVIRQVFDVQARVVQHEHSTRPFLVLGGE